MTKKEFKKLVARALDSMPEHIMEKLENVVVTVEDEPTAEQLDKQGLEKDELLLGLYEGIPQSSWGRGFGGHLPDKITIFKNSVEKVAKTPEEIEREVMITVWHEIAHHFGLEHPEIEDLEKRRDSGHNNK